MAYFIRLIKPTLYFLLVLGLISTIYVAYQFYHQLHQPMISMGNSIIIQVKPGSSAGALVDTLYEKKLIASKSPLLHLIKYKRLANHLKAGVYEVFPGESAEELIDNIVAGNVLSLPFRIIEGTNQTLISSNMQAAPYLNYHPDDWLTIQASYPTSEGLLLADTYQYQADSDAKNLLKQANQHLMDYLTTSWKDRSQGLPYRNAYEMLVAASIIEKETAVSDERKIISGIIINRLNKKMPLQMDPTVIYALGTAYAGKLSHDDLTFDSPYNTYRYRGLPPAPIAMVGKDSLDAAAHPQRSNYLYFVAKGDGTHEFSETYTDQRKAIFRYMNKGAS